MAMLLRRRRAGSVPQRIRMSLGANIALLLTVAVLATAGIGVLLWWALGHPSVQGGAWTAANSFDFAKVVLAIVGGIGAVVALVVAYRKQHLGEAAEVREDTKLFAERFTKAADQLGSDKAPVRLAGMYALEGLAQGAPEQRQMIVNVLCAYLRMPYLPPTASSPRGATGAAGTPDAPAPSIASIDNTDGQAGHLAQQENERREQERQVRLTAQRILAAHLRPGENTARPAETFWSDTDLDLTGATLVDLDLSGCHVHVARFGGAQFRGTTWFAGAQFGETAWFSEAQFHGEATFGKAQFGGTAIFDRAHFTQEVWFTKAQFTADAWFEAAQFGGNAAFDEARCTGDATFSEVQFTGNIVFSEAEFGGDATFRRAQFGGNTGFEAAQFTGNAVFSDAQFGGDTTFERAQFGRDTGFSGAQFGGAVGFNWAQFGRDSRFVGTQFGGTAGFDGAQFGRDAGFGGAQFGGAVEFDWAQFGGDIRFNKARVRLDVRTDIVRRWPGEYIVADPGSAEGARLPGQEGRWGYLTRNL